MTSTHTVVSLHVYPLKSAAAVEVQAAPVTPRGLAGDRRYMLIDSDGEFLSARRHPRLLLVRASLEAAGLRCIDPDQKTLTVTTPTEGPMQTVEIWGQHTSGRDAGDDAARWFSEFLGISCRLVYQAEYDRRPVKPRPSTVEGDVVSFADSYPLLLIGTASLAALNEEVKGGGPIPMARFRPNVVVNTQVAFEEDHWTEIAIGASRFVNVKRCPRCVLTTLDPETAQKDPNNEPLAALARFRRDRDNKGLWFGTNIVPRNRETIRVGDTVDAVVGESRPLGP